MADVTGGFICFCFFATMVFRLDGVIFLFMEQDRIVGFSLGISKQPSRGSCDLGICFYSVLWKPGERC